MEYILKKTFIESVNTVKITAEYYCELKSARHILNAAFELEQSYEIILNNFLDLEKQTLGIMCETLIRDNREYSQLFEVSSILNTRLINLVASTRFYLDCTPQHMKFFNYNNIDCYALFERKRKEKYDNHFEYRFMETFRNHLQHCGTAVHGISHPSKRLSVNNHQLFEQTLHILVSRDLLSENDKFKKSVLNEMPEEVDLFANVKKYIELISELHVYVRELISIQVSGARDTILSSHKKYSQVHEESLLGLCAFEMDKTIVKYKVPLLLEWDDVRIKLQNSNPELINLSKRFVTNKSTNS